MLELLFEVNGQRYRVNRSDSRNLQLSKWDWIKKKDGSVSLGWRFDGYYGPKGVQRRIHELVADDVYLKDDLVGYFQKIDRRLEAVESMIESCFSQEKEMNESLQKNIDAMRQAAESVDQRLQHISNAVDDLAALLEKRMSIEISRERKDKDDDKGVF